MKDANGTAGSQPLNSYGFTEYREYDELNRLRKVVAADNSQTQYG